MSVDALKAAREQLEQAKKTINSEAKAAVNEAVLELLRHDDIETVAWAAKATAYNDEGMYEGIHGPHLNVPGYNPEEGINGLDSEVRWDLVGYNAASNDARVAELQKILEYVGEEILCEIFGDEALVIAYLRTGDDDRVEYESEYVGV